MQSQQQRAQMCGQPQVLPSPFLLQNAAGFSGFLQCFGAVVSCPAVEVIPKAKMWRSGIVWVGSMQTRANTMSLQIP